MEKKFFLPGLIAKLTSGLQLFPSLRKTNFGFGQFLSISGFHVSRFWLIIQIHTVVFGVYDTDTRN